MEWTVDKGAFGLQQWQLNFNGLTLCSIVEPKDGQATVFPLVGEHYGSDKGLEQLQRDCESEVLREMMKACNQIVNNRDSLNK